MIPPRLPIRSILSNRSVLIAIATFYLPKRERKTEGGEEGGTDDGDDYRAMSK
jgi:hypothetical protein